MFNNKDVFDTIASKVSDSINAKSISPWLKAELKELIEDDQSLVQLLFYCEVGCTDRLIDGYFDSQRNWESGPAKSLANKIIDSDKNIYRKFSMRLLVKAGLSTKLALYALEETKYKDKTGPTFYMNPFEQIFALNVDLRNKKVDINGKVTDSGKAGATSKKLYIGDSTNNKNMKKRNL